MSEISKVNTPPYVKYLGPLTRFFEDFDFSFIKPVRQKGCRAVESKTGRSRVIDAGCGIGGSFPYLADAVGSTGEVVGIEISPESKLGAERRIAKNRWQNVRVIEAAAQTVSLTGTFDGLLMFAAADVYASEEALENILPHLKDDARVVFFGAKFSRRRAGLILNPVFRMLFKLSFSTTPAPTYEPWHIATNYVDKIEVEEYFFGSMFLAWGTVVTKNRGV